MDLLQDKENRFCAMVATARDLDNYVLRLRTVIGHNAAIRLMRGRRMQTKELLLDEFAAALQFPLYFGRNWDAFEECMADLQWLPAKGYVLIISDAGSLLRMEPANGVVVLFEILDRVAREWAAGKLPDINLEQEPVPFHVLLQDDASSIADLRHTLRPVVGDIPVVSEGMN